MTNGCKRIFRNTQAFLQESNFYCKCCSHKIADFIVICSTIFEPKHILFIYCISIILNIRLENGCIDKLYNIITVGIALGNSTSFYAWKPDRELTYRFESQTLTGIPGIDNQYSGLKLASNVVIQSFADYTLRSDSITPGIRL